MSHNNCCMCLTDTENTNDKINFAANDNEVDKGEKKDLSSSPSDKVIVLFDAENTKLTMDVTKIAKLSTITEQEIISVANDNNLQPLTTSKDLPDAIKIISGHVNTAKILSNSTVLGPQVRKFFLCKAQQYAYIWLCSEVQLGMEIRKIKTHPGTRTDLGKTVKMLRTKKQILSEDYNLTEAEARDISRLTKELVDKELEYAVDNNEVPSRRHALSFLARQPEYTKEEEDENTVSSICQHTKAKFKFETVMSDIPFEQVKNYRIKERMPYCSLFSCIGSGEYYLEQHGLDCVLANEMDPKRAKYFTLKNPTTEMVVGDFRKKFNVLVTKFKEKKCKLLLASLPCQTFCPQKGKNWMDDDRLTLLVDYIRFVKEVKPEYLVVENAKEFFGFSLPLENDYSAHPITEGFKKILNGRTIGGYIQDELTEEGLEYHLNFSIENACYYGTAQNRIRSILLGAKKEIWKFPKPEEFGVPMWKAIGDLPSLEPGETSDFQYHTASHFYKDFDTNAESKEKEIQIINALAHTVSGACPCDNPPVYQLPGFGFFKAKGARKFWDRPSNTIDSGSGEVSGLRTIHPGRIRKDGTYSDCRPLTLLEVILLNGLPSNYKIPVEFEKNETFVRHVMGEIFLPRMLERICSEIPAEMQNVN